MNVAVMRVLTLAVLAVPATAAAQASPTSPRSGDTRASIPPHVRENLWPSRQLSPVEQELRSHLLVLGDSIRPVEAIHDQASRQQRAGTNASVFRSTGRTLAGNCARAGRATEQVIEFAAGLSTSNERWGDRAVNRWRTALDALKSEMNRCDRSATAEIEGDKSVTPSRITTISASAHKVVTEYRRAESELLNTLQIKIDPRDRQ